MDFNFLSKKDEGNKGKKRKEGSKFSGSIAMAIFIFMIITALYLIISDTSNKEPEVSLSDLAKNVQAGDVKKITVQGEQLTITYKNDEVKKSKKETESSLSQTLFNYGVKPEILPTPPITVTNQSHSS